MIGVAALATARPPIASGIVTSDNAAGISDNSAGFSDNSAKIGDGAAEIVDIGIISP